MSLLFGLISSVSVGGIIGGITGFVTSLPSGFAVWFILPGVLIGVVVGAVALFIGVAVERSIRLQKGVTNIAAKFVSSLAAAVAAALLVGVTLDFANSPNVIGISLFSLGTSAILAFFAHPFLVKECRNTKDQIPTTVR